MSSRSEFIPELAAAGVYHNHMHSKEDEPLRYLTPDSDESEVFTKLSSKTDSLYQVPTVNPDGYDYLSDRSPTTKFTTRSIAEENMRDLQNFLKQQLSSGFPDQRSYETKIYQGNVLPCSPQRMDNEAKVIPVERKNSKVLKTEEGNTIAKKLATQAEQKGMRECHVYFTPRTSAEIWPPLVVTVGEDWDFMKVMRKSIADLQRSMNKGERDGTHDWLFDYHPNKEISKIRNDLKVLFGKKVVTFRDSHLKKSIKDITGDFINRMWILQKSDDKSHKVRRERRANSIHELPRESRAPYSRNRIKGRSKSFHHKAHSKPPQKRYSRISKRL